MKRLLVLTIAMTLLFTLLVSCNGNNSPSGGNQPDSGENGDQNKPDTPDSGNQDNKPEGGNQDNKPEGGNQDNNTPEGGSTDDVGEESGEAFKGNDDLAELCVLSSETATVTAETAETTINVKLTSGGASKTHTVRVPVDESWDTVKVVQGKTTTYVKVYTKNGVSLVDFSMLSESDDAVITPALTKNEEKLESEFGMTLSNGTKIDTNYYPGFVRKSVTFTIDDGDIANDTKFINIVKPAGIIGTFNLCRTTDVSSAEYLALYDGFEVANHNQLHALPFRETADYHTGKSFASILKDQTYSSGADINFAYKTSIDGLYYINYHYYSQSYIGKTSWHAMASDQTYFKYTDITKNNIDALFGEGSVVGFAYPHGVVTESVKQYLKDMGYLYARRTGTLKDSTSFALPSDRYEWTYNADVSCLLDVMAKYDEYEDDGNLKFFAFGVHAADFDGNWEVLEQFAATYGNRQSEFWYASNREIFEYEDAIKALDINEERIVNDSKIAVFITINGERVIIPANSVYYLDGTVKAKVTYDSDNGSSLKSENLEIGSLVKIPTSPSKNGFTFVGWYNGDKEWNFSDRITESMTLKAKYEATPFGGSTAEVLPVKGGASGIVAIIHDDGRSETGYILDDLYYKYGLVGDVAMIVGNIYDSQTQKPNSEYYKWKSIVNTGRWGVMSHSLTHTWWGNVTKDASGANVKWNEDENKMYDEAVVSQNILRNLFPSQRVLSFVYPGFGAESKGLTKEETFDILYSAKARELISEYYVSARYAGENAPAYVTKDSDWMFLDGFFLYASNINSTGANSLKNRLESAANNGTIQLISIHAVSDELAPGTMDSGNYTLSSVDMETACALISEYVNEGKIWNAHYDDAILYVREAQNASVTVSGDEEGLTVILTDTMDNDIYSYPLTVRITVPGTWEYVKITQGDSASYVKAKYLNGKWLIDADIVPDGGAAILTSIEKSDIPYSPTKTPNPPASTVLPEGPTTPPDSLLDIEVTVDFESPSGATVDESNSIALVNRDGGKALQILDTLTNASGNIIIPFGKISTPEAFSFTFDINVAEATGLAATLYFADYFNTPYMLTLNASGAGYSFGDCQSNTGGLGITTSNLTGSTPLQFNKWYTIKIDVILTSIEDFKVVFYVDGVKTGESTNRANNNKGATAPIQNTVKCLKISTFNSALLDMQLDNLVMKAGIASVLGLDGSSILLGTDFESGIDFVTNARPTHCTIESASRPDDSENHALMINKFEKGKSADISITSTASSNETKEFIFEFDINVTSADNGLLAQIFFSTGVSDSPIDFTVTATSLGFYFATLSSYTSGTYKSFGSSDSILSYNKFYHVKLHVAVGTSETFTATLYIDGEKIGTSNNFLNPEGKENYEPARKVNTVLIGCQSTSKCTMYIDNVSLAAK